jgi:membrane-bound ClpP family serine protease
MDDKGEVSRLKGWLIVLASLLDDIAITVLIFLGLWFFHVRITWTIVLIVVLVMVAFVFIMHRAIIPSLRRRKVTGGEGMIGMVGTVTEPCRPKGTIKIKDEYWKAVSTGGDIGVGEVIEVVGIHGLNLEVRKKSHE